jgi:hypothetical protein
LEEKIKDVGIFKIEGNTYKAAKLEETERNSSCSGGADMLSFAAKFGGALSG